MRHLSFHMSALAAAVLFVLTTVGCTTVQSQDPIAPLFNGPVALSEPITVGSQRVHLDTLLTGLDLPWGMAFLGADEMLITERGGRIRHVLGGMLQPDGVAGGPEVYVHGQGGLLDVEAHPDYASNGWVYLSYANPGRGGGHTAIMRGMLENGSLTNQEVLFEGGPMTRGRVHFAGRLTFDRNNDLYFSIGDRGEMQNAQDLSNHSGKVFRLHDDGRVPADNPFINTADAAPEIFTYGHRNPQGMALHPKTGALWTHEHGPQGGDEINIERAGANYGWPTITYGINYNGSIITEETQRAGMEQPVHYWVPSIAPSGMDFPPASRYPAWDGDLIVGALKFMLLSHIDLEGDTFVAEHRFFEGIGRVREVEVGPDGYLYVLTEAPGALYRLWPASE